MYREVGMRLKELKDILSNRFAVNYIAAILVVSVLVVFLSSFGIISPEGKKKYDCFFSESLECLDYKITSNSATIVVENRGDDMIINSVEARGCGEQIEGVVLRNMETAAFVFDNCKNEDSGDNIKKDIKIKYSDVAGASGMITGNVVSVVE